MTDYTGPSANGTLMIRDLGSDVEFWVFAASSVYWNNLQFSVNANGTTYPVTQPYNGDKIWVKVTTINIPSAGPVNFNLLTATGTQGLGGPNTVSATLSRGGVPNPSSTPSLSSVGSDRVTVLSNDGSNNGYGIDGRQVGYGLNPSSATNFLGYLTPGVTVTGLQSGKTYYFWVRTHNALGWSAWSPQSSAFTTRIPDAPNTPVLSQQKQSSVYAAFTFIGKSDGRSAILQWRIGYGTNPAGPTSYYNASSGTITGLVPGSKYYFWSQARNAVGWGPLSPPSSAGTVAGSRVLVGFKWKAAVPYVKVGLVWKPAEPWGKAAGKWKKSS